MITFVAGAALACELLGTALVFLDTKRTGVMLSDSMR